MNNDSKKSPSVWAALSAGLASIVLFLPFPFVMPRAGLDPSFMLAVNEAIAQGMAFGRDIIITVGPLSTIWSRAYHPATISVAFLGGALFAIGHAYVAYTVSRNSPRWWVWIYLVFLTCLLESRDALFLVYPMLLALLIYRISLPAPHADRIGLSRGETVGFAVAVSPLGLLPLIKLSFLPMGLAVCALGFLLLWTSAQKLAAASLILIPPLSAVLFWVICGQAPSGLADYFLNSASIMSGYTRAMSQGMFFVTPLMFIVTSLAVLLYFYRARPSLDTRDYAFLVLVVVFLFMSFKAGFVRHDAHALAASSSLVMATVAVSGLGNASRKRMVVVFLMALVTWLSIHVEYNRSGLEHNKSLISQLNRRLKAWSSGQSEKKPGDGSYGAYLAEIRSRMPIPQLHGTADIYPFETASLIASGNKWSPRPVFQSYSAYTPDLDTLNVQHLLGPKSPDNILFTVQPIDTRYPSTEDGPSWPVLLAGYELADVADRYLLLRRRAGAISMPAMTPLWTKPVRLRERVDIGPREGIVYAKITIAPSLLGRVANVLFKPTELRITVELSDGKTQRHRIVPGQAVSGFVLSPYVASKEDFAKLMAARGTIAALPSVVGLSIEETPRDLGMWDAEFSLALYRLDFAAIQP